MSQSNRTLIIHAGGAKTASSAIQNYLELNATQLKQCGIDYLNRVGITHKEQITNGNGVMLHRELRSKASLQELVMVLESYFDENNLAICSSEFFQNLKQQYWELLYSAALQSGINLHVVFIIRDVATYFISWYDQRIKCHGLSTNLMTFLEKSSWRHLDFLKTIKEFIGKIKLSVIHYDSNRNEIIDKFIEALDLNIKLPPPELNFIVNRSFSRCEREILLKLNEKYGEKFSKSASAEILFAFPNKEVDRQYEPEVLSHLQERFSNDIIWINEIFFSAEPVVKVIAQNALQESKSSSIEDEKVQIYNVLLTWACNKSILAEQHFACPRSWKLTVPLRSLNNILINFRGWFKQKIRRLYATN